MDLGRLETLMQARLGFVVTDVAEIDPGVPHNNRLLHLWSADGREAVAKTYFRDDRDRLDREYTALAFLHACAIAEVPTPYLRDDVTCLGVYSFESGTTPRAVELTTAHMEALAAFAARLRAIRPGVAGANFRTSTSATFSLPIRSRASAPAWRSSKLSRPVQMRFASYENYGPRSTSRVRSSA